MVIDTRYLNTLIDKPRCNGPIEPIQVIPTKINGQNHTIADMNSAYNQMTLVEQSLHLAQFVNWNQEYEFEWFIYGIWKGSAAFLAFMSKVFQSLTLSKIIIT